VEVLLTAIAIRQTEYIDCGQDRHDVLRKDFPDKDQAKRPVENLELWPRIPLLSMERL